MNVISSLWHICGPIMLAEHVFHRHRALYGSCKCDYAGQRGLDAATNGEWLGSYSSGLGMPASAHTAAQGVKQSGGVVGGASRKKWGGEEGRLDWEGVDSVAAAHTKSSPLSQA